MTKNISSRVISQRTVFNYFTNVTSLLKSVPIAVTYPEIFFGISISAGGLRAAVTPLMGPGESLGGGPGWGKFP